MSIITLKDWLIIYLPGSCALKKAYGFKGLYLAAFEDQTIYGVLPMIAFKGLGGSASLISLPYCDAAGPLADSPEIAAPTHHKGA